jgi:O-antigen/teichoic acid export membrane protein
MVIGLILIAIGVIAILVKTDVLTGSIWGYVWPTALVIIGLSFVIGRFRRRRWWWGWSPPWEDRDRDRKE